MRSRHQSLWRKKCATILAPSLRDTKFCSETGAPHHPRPSPPCLDCGLEPIATKYCPETGRLHRAGPTHITSPIPKTHETNLRRVNHDSGDELPPHVRLREEGQHDEGRARNPPLTRRHDESSGRAIHFGIAVGWVWNFCAGQSGPEPRLPSYYK